MTLTLDQEQELSKEISPIVKCAGDLVIKTPEHSINAQELLKDIKGRQKRITEFFSGIKASAHSAWKAVVAKETSYLEPLAEAEKVIKGKVIAYESEAEKKRQDEARIQEAARQERERKERIRLEEQASKAREAGKVEKAEALEEKAASVVAAPIFTPPPATSKAQGTAFKKTWKGDVTDFKALCQSIIDGRVAVDVIAPNYSVINKLAAVCKDSMVIPGLKFTEETSMAVRS